MSVEVTTTFTGNPTAAVDAMSFYATDVDDVDESDNSEIRYYFSAECTGQDTAKSPVFSGNGAWLGWIPPAAGSWTVHLRKVADDSSVTSLAVTAE